MKPISSFVFRAALVAGLGLGTAAFAAPQTTFQCKVKINQGQGGWIPEVLFLGLEEGSKDVVVSDPIILHFNQRQPIKGKLVVDNDRRRTVAWKLKTNTRGQKATISYRATIQKSDGSLSLGAKPLGYSNVISGTGQCTEKKLK